MLDIKLIRENPERVKTDLKRRGLNGVLVDEVLMSDEKRRTLVTEIDTLRREQNRFSEEIGRSANGEREQFLTEAQQLKEKLHERENVLKETEGDFEHAMYRLPNLLAEDVPDGLGEKDNVVLREVGAKPQFDFPPRDYMEIARALDLIDTQHASRVSGSRFGYLKKGAAELEIALIQFAFARLRGHGFIPVIPPVLVREEVMRGMGYVDTEEDREERYFLERDGLYLVGTSEQSVAPMHGGEILEESALPLRYAAFSTCFRREAGSYGKDTRGILRVHQFDKIEMVSVTTAETSRDEHQMLLGIEEELMISLCMPYRVVALSAGDLARPSAATYDIETWLPGQQEGQGQYRETHSTSDTTSFQSRRLNIRVRRRKGAIEFVHILNGTAFAIGRTIIALLENYQQKDGSVVVPAALRPYMGGAERLTP